MVTPVLIAGCFMSQKHAGVSQGRSYQCCLLVASRPRNMLVYLKDGHTSVVCWLLHVPETCWCISGTVTPVLFAGCFMPQQHAGISQGQSYQCCLLHVPTTCWCISGMVIPALFAGCFMSYQTPQPPSCPWQTRAMLKSIIIEWLLPRPSNMLVYIRESYQWLIPLLYFVVCWLLHVLSDPTATFMPMADTSNAEEHHHWLTTTTSQQHAGIHQGVIPVTDTSNSNPGPLAAALTGAWHYRVNATNSWPGVHVLWLGGSKSDVQLLSTCGSTYKCPNRSIPETHLHVAGTLSNQQTASVWCPHDAQQPLLIQCC